MAWRRDELYRARGTLAARGLSSEALEDIYQETAVALMQRPYVNEEHLRSALRWGFSHRALRLFRDERRRADRIKRHAQESQGAISRSEHAANPEVLTESQEDRLVVAEFLTELNDEERRVFWLMAEGMSYWAIATAHGSTVAEARKVIRACKRKREQWQILYDTGRLCGYRSETIQAILDGHETSEELANRAIAHLDRCAHCRSEHKTNARKLKDAFKGQAAGLLAPTLLTKAGWLTRLLVKGRMAQERLPGAEHLSSLREQASMLVAGGGLGNQLARGVTAAAVLAAGAVGASHALQQPTPKHAAVRHSAAHPRREGAPVEPTSPPNYGLAHRHTATRESPSSPGHVVTAAPRQERHNSEPGGFAYLGVPARQPRPSHPAESSQQRGGGPFGP